jgi:tRNA A37 threonylcarbamoyladenosine modification protein TsaB
MYKIWIDASERFNKIVRLTQDDKVVAEKSGDIDIVSSVKDILKSKNIDPRDVEIYEPQLGPGSFTGLKIGVTAANVLNWALKKRKSNELYYPNYGREPNISERKKPL